MQQVEYASRPVAIPPSFLAGPSATPISAHAVPFAASSLPEYNKTVALILDDVLSADECAQLLALAEDSVPRPENAGAGFSAWRPALVSMGDGFEIMNQSYRNSDRIVWDEQTVVDRLWRRCADVPEVQETLAKVNTIAGDKDGEWVFHKPNRRMRFLKYSEGQFFKPHIDGPYYYDEDGREFQTHFTLHLYLNDSAVITGSPDGLVGGATAFLSYDKKRRLDVNPKAGSVLLFQHRWLLHEGAQVERGTKYTMRTDIIFEFEKFPKRKE